MKNSRCSCGRFFCRLLLITSLLAGAVLVQALVQGYLPVLPGLLLGALLLLGINALCGALLPAEQTPQRRPEAAKVRRVRRAVPRRARVAAQPSPRAGTARRARAA